MKRILIVGANSFIAKVFMNSLDRGSFVTLSVRDDKWQSYDYSTIDTIVYFAAIVHHPEICDENLYDKVNAVIPYGMARIAKDQGVRKFIYISSVAVFGIGPKFGARNQITKETPLIPISLYGKSKLKGESLLNSVPELTIQIVRLPNVYGKNCPGTFYPTIRKLANLRWLPSYGAEYKFSLISVDNVAKALNRLLNSCQSGVFIPQDTPILSIMERIKMLAKLNGIKQQHINMRILIWVANRIFPKKYTNNLYGGFYVNPDDFPVLTD